MIFGGLGHYSTVLAALVAASMFTLPAAANSANAIPAVKPKPKPPLNPNLLRWDESAQNSAFIKADQPDVFWDKDIRERYSLYGANLYSMNLDVSVALKPGRLMSLDAAW